MHVDHQAVARCRAARLAALAVAFAHHAAVRAAAASSDATNVARAFGDWRGVGRSARYAPASPDAHDASRDRAEEQAHRRPRPGRARFDVPPHSRSSQEYCRSSTTFMAIEICAGRLSLRHQPAPARCMASEQKNRQIVGEALSRPYDVSTRARPPRRPRPGSRRALAFSADSRPLSSNGCPLGFSASVMPSL